MIDERVGGLTMPAIGLGTMRQHDEQCTRLVEAALAEGYRHLDTARKYGNEEAVGRGIARSSVSREEIVVTTKLSHLELEPDQVRAGTQDSLRRLGLDHIDLLLIHWPNPATPLADTLDAMTQLREQGSVRAIGVANFPAWMLEQAVGLADVVTDQIEYHPYLDQSAVRGACRAHGVVVTAYCPLGRAGRLLDDPVLRRIGDEVGRSVAQVVLRWLVQQPGVVAIPGASSVEHLRENLAVHDLHLDDDQVAAITALDRGERIVDPDHAPDWDD